MSIAFPSNFGPQRPWQTKCIQQKTMSKIAHSLSSKKTETMLSDEKRNVPYNLTTFLKATTGQAYGIKNMIQTAAKPMSKKEDDQFKKTKKWTAWPAHVRTVYTPKK